MARGLPTGWPGVSPTGWPGVSRPVARGQKFMCCVRNPRNINIFVRVPGREDSGTRPGGSVTGVTEKLFMCQMFMSHYVPFPAPNFRLIFRSLNRVYEQGAYNFRIRSSQTGTLQTGTLRIREKFLEGRQKGREREGKGWTPLAKRATGQFSDKVPLSCALKLKAPPFTKFRHEKGTQT